MSEVDSMTKTDKQRWLEATEIVLIEAGVPLHYTDIKRAIINRRLVPHGSEVNLDHCLGSSHGERVCEVPGQSGYYRILKTEPTEMDSPSRMSKVKDISKVKVEDREISMSQGSEGDIDTGSSGYVKYRQKYHRLKRLAKDLIFLNAAYCDEVIHTEEEIIELAQQRRYLLNLVLQKQTLASVTPQPPTPSSKQRHHPPPHPNTPTGRGTHTPKPHSIASLLDGREKKTNRKRVSSVGSTTKGKSTHQTSSKSKVKSRTKSTISKIKQLDPGADTNPLTAVPHVYNHLTGGDNVSAVSEVPVVHMQGFNSSEDSHSFPPQILASHPTNLLGVSPLSIGVSPAAVPGIPSVMSLPGDSQLPMIGAGAGEGNPRVGTKSAMDSG